MENLETNIKNAVRQIANELLTPPLGNCFDVRIYDAGSDKITLPLREEVQTIHQHLLRLFAMWNDLQQKNEARDEASENLAWCVDCESKDLLRHLSEAHRELKKGRERLKGLRDKLCLVWRAVGLIDQFDEDVLHALDGIKE